MIIFGNAKKKNIHEQKLVITDFPFRHIGHIMFMGKKIMLCHAEDIHTQVELHKNANFPYTPLIILLKIPA